METFNPFPTFSPVRISGSVNEQNDDDEGEALEHASPSSMYSNLTVVSVVKTGWRDKGAWMAIETEPSPVSSSGTFSRLVKTTVCKKVEKAQSERPESHGVTLNLHQFQMDSGESLGEDPERWARLTF